MTIPFCKDCKHSKRDVAEYYSYYECRHPVIKYQQSPVYGFKYGWPSCETCRMSDGQCGPEGKLFEPRPASLLLQRLWRRLLSYVPQSKVTTEPR